VAIGILEVVVVVVVIVVGVVTTSALMLLIAELNLRLQKLILESCVNILIESMI
jgi:hypothetical protein